MKIFAKGKRGLIYKQGNIITKVKNPKSKAINRIKNEAKYLKLLNKYKIGPKFVSFKKNKLKYYFVKGDFIVDFIKKNKKEKIIKVLKDILQQCHRMDKLKINKLEMHHPVKHIIIDKKPVLIDFERCYKTNKPKNVTQFIQFIISNNLRNELLKKKVKINRNKFIKLAKDYKKDMNKKNLNKIINTL